MITFAIVTLYAIAALGAGYIMWKVKRDVNYWPLIRLLAAMIFAVLGHALAIWALMRKWPWLAHDPVQPTGRALFAAAVCVWGALLIRRINRLPRGYVADLAGQAQPEGVEAAVAHLEAAARLLRRGVLDTHTWRATVDRGLAAPAPEEGGEA